MSHYSVAVFTEPHGSSVDELLEPYDENIIVDSYVSHTKDDLIKMGRERIESIKTGAYAEYLKDPQKYLRERCENNPENPHYVYISTIFPKALGWTDEQVYQNELGYYEPEDINEDGNVVSTYNPQSKWDWYQVGGRFKERLKVRGVSGFQDGAFVPDIDFQEMELDRARNLVPYDTFLSTYTWESPEYLKLNYPSEDIYIKRRTAFSTYAVVTPDGEWHAPGETGWWGTSSESPEERIDWELNFYSRFIKLAIEKGWYMTIVDCHI